MKYCSLILSLAAVLLLSSRVSAVSQESFLTPYQGNPTPPALIRPDMDGRMHDLSHYRGQVVLVSFWASWCPPCVHEMPSMQHLADRLKQVNTPFRILAVNIGEEKALMETFLQEVKVNFTILLDENSELVRSWGVYAYPSTFLIDKQGKIRYALFGAIDWNTDQSYELIRTLAAE